MNKYDDTDYLIEREESIEYEEGSDMNVGSIEKDIKRCEELTRPEHANWIGISNQLAIAHVVDKIKEVEEENKTILNSKVGVDISYDDYIPKQKIKDLKESVTLDNTIVGGRRNAKTLEYGIKLGKIKACEELLEDK